MGMHDDQKPNKDERIIKRGEGTGRDLGQNPMFSGNGMRVGRQRRELPDMPNANDSEYEVGSFTQRDEKRLSRGAVASPFGATGIAVSGPNVYMGCCLMNDANTATVVFRDRNANGTVIRAFSLAANEIVNDYVVDGINVNNIHVTITGTLLSGTVYVGATE